MRWYWGYHMRMQWEYISKLIIAIGQYPKLGHCRGLHTIMDILNSLIWFYICIFVGWSPFCWFDDLSVLLKKKGDWLNPRGSRNSTKAREKYVVSHVSTSWCYCSTLGSCYIEILIGSTRSWKEMKHLETRTGDDVYRGFFSIQP